MAILVSSSSQSNMNAAICLEAEDNGRGLQLGVACSWPAAGGPGRHPQKGTCRPTPKGLALVWWGSAEELKMPSLFRGKGNFSRLEDLFCTNGSWYIHAGGEEPFEDRCVLSFWLKSFSINRRKLARECYKNFF